MNENKSDLGGYFSIAAGVSYIIVGITFFQLPEIQRGSSIFRDVKDYLISVAADPSTLAIQYWFFGLAAIMGMGVIVALKRYMKSEGQDILKLEPEIRSRMGLFLAFQYPLELPGVRAWQFLKAGVDAKRVHNGEEVMTAREFDQMLKAKVASATDNVSALKKRYEQLWQRLARKAGLLQGRGQRQLQHQPKQLLPFYKNLVLKDCLQLEKAN